jgi:hypothetical protein
MLSGTPSASVAAEIPVGIAVLHSTTHGPGDALRDGAGEFVILLRVAQVQRTSRAAGIVSVGDRNGTLQGGERALRQAALSGVTVVKLAPAGEVAPSPDDLFLDAGHLTEQEASRLLARCLERFGAPPAAAHTERPTGSELAAIQAHLQRLRDLFSRENGLRVAAQ